MGISQLSLTDFRNLKSTTLDFDPRLNLVCGDNGSGKTSLLEAIFVLCQAHSFRTHQLKQCVQHGREGFLLFGRFDGFKAGLAKRDKKLEIHIDGEALKRRSELVRRAPVNIVNADSFKLIDGAPQQRRSYLDWCLFHVEHDYAERWAGFQHAIKQRNRLLKTRQDLNLLDYWDQYLVEPSERLSELRADYCRKIQAIISDQLGEVMRDLPLKLEYRRGWSEDLDLGKALIKNRERDVKQGFTGVGIHRDEIDLTVDGRPVGEVLSRGQSKRLCLALLLAVLKLVDQSRKARIILLIDDLHSELDQPAQAMVYRQLDGLDLQLFISNIEPTVSTPVAVKEFRMFHVEHGIIKPRNIS